MAIKVGTCYLLCFDRRFGHAAHYLGWTADALEGRLAAHARGDGANLLKHVKAAGIGWVLTRTWRRVDRHEERRLKNRGGKARLCPRCQQQLAFVASALEAPA